MDNSCPPSPVFNRIQPMEFDLVSSTTSASMSMAGCSSYSSLASGRSTPTPGGIIGVMRKAVRRYHKCQLCGDSSEQTQHCVHCGLTLCDRDRNKHIKEVIDSLRNLKLTSNRHTKTANDKKDRISQTIIETEQSRQIAKQRVVEEFRHLNNILNSRKQELLNQLDAFGQDELILLNEDKIILDQYVKELRSVEAELHPRLASYTGMSDTAFAKLCQAKIAYQDRLVWIESVLEKDDSFFPIVFQSNTEFRETCISIGSIGYGQPKQSRQFELSRRKSMSNLKMTGSELSKIETGHKSSNNFSSRTGAKRIARSNSFGSSLRNNSTSNLRTKSSENLIWQKNDLWE